MRMPRFRVRTLMVAVAVVAVPLGICMERRSRFLVLAELHTAEFVKAKRSFEDSYPSSDVPLRAVAWHAAIRKKYIRAARYPWLTVEPDPPEPK